MANKWIILVTDGAGRPVLVVDETGEPAIYDSEDEAEDVLAVTPFALSYPSKVVELP